MIWSSEKGHPPCFTPVANGVIEQLLEERYFISAYWDETQNEGDQVVIDVSLPHRICPEFPGISIGRVICGPPPTSVVAVGRHQEAGLRLDAAEPQSFQKLSRFFKAAGSHNTHRS